MKEKMISKKIEDALYVYSKYGIVGSVLSTLFYVGAQKEGVSHFETKYLSRCAEGSYATAWNDLAVSFPDELVELYGGEEAQYDYIEFENPVGIEKVPFDDAMKIMEIAAKYYVEYRPDRREAVDDLLARARVSFARLQKNHDRWKRENG